MSLVKNPPTQLWKTEEENRTYELIDEKPSKLNKEMWEENRKIIDIVWWTRKENPEVCDESRNLDNERLGQNKVLCSFSGVELPPCRLSNAPIAKETDLRQPAGFWL